MSPAWPPASRPRPRVVDLEATGESARPLPRLEAGRRDVLLRDGVFRLFFLPAVFLTCRAFARDADFLLTPLFPARVVVLFLLLPFFFVVLAM